MSEKALWRQFKTVFGFSGHWVRIENDLEAGTPDVNGCISGTEWWLELKHTSTWPKRHTTKVKLNHFTMAQRKWLVRRGGAGGNCGVLWQISKEYFLFGWHSAPDLGELSKTQLEKTALWQGTSLKAINLLLMLRKGLK